jgi:hypothetical protein
MSDHTSLVVHSAIAKLAVRPGALSPIGRGTRFRTRRAGRFLVLSRANRL